MSEETQDMLSQYLTFNLRDESFAVLITRVREVLDVTSMTVVPRMPDYMNGVINLRGNVVPVMDLGLKLGMDPIIKTRNTCIMIVEVEAEGTMVQMGAITDSVQMVVDLAPKDIESVPKMGTGLNTEFIQGMGHLDDKFLIILDIDRILASEGRAVLRDQALVAAETE